MAKRKKSVRTKRNMSPKQRKFRNCMSGKTGEIHKQRELLKKEYHRPKLTPKEAGLAMGKAAKICKTTK